VFKIFGLIIASNQSIQCYIDKSLDERMTLVNPTIHSLTQSLAEVKKTFDDTKSISESVASDIAELESQYSELQNKVEEFPDPSDIVTSETFGNELENNDIVTRDDLSDFVEADAVQDHVDFSDIGDHLDLDSLTAKVMEKIAENFAGAKK